MKLSKIEQETIILFNEAEDTAREVVGTIPIVDIPQVSDYKWQLDCLNDRLQHPEKYAPFEDVEEHIAQLRQWLATHKEKKAETA